MSFSSLEADPSYMRAFDSVQLNATDYPDIETIKKDLAKDDLKVAILNTWDELLNSSTQSTQLDTLSVEFETEFERALALRQLYYIYFEEGGEFGSKNYERAKEFKQRWIDEITRFSKLKSDTIAKTDFGLISRG